MLKLILTYAAKTMPWQLPGVMSCLARYAARLGTVGRPRLGALDWRCLIGLAYGPNTTSSPHTGLTRPRRIHPRRTRCGLSLFEALLVILIAIPMTQQGVRLAEDYIRQQAGVQESRLLTQVVTAASTFALRDLNKLITYTVGVGNVQVVTLDDLARQNAWVSPNARTALGRDIQVIFHARGLGELVVLARAFTPDGEYTRSYVPRGGIGIGLVGTIREDADDRLVGPGLDYDLSAIRDAGKAMVGDHFALAVLRMDQDVLPFLHRKAVDGLEKLNRMETNLDMGEFDLVGVGELKATKITVTGAMEIGKLTGQLNVDGDIEVGDNLTIPGTLTSAEAVINGQITANRLDVSGLATFSDVDAGSVTAPTVSVTDAITVTGDTGEVSAKSLTAGTLNAHEIKASGKSILGTLQAGDVISLGNLDAETVVVTEDLFVNGSCTGCE